MKNKKALFSLFGVATILCATYSDSAEAARRPRKNTNRTVQWQITSQSVSESVGTVQVTAVLSGPTSTSVSIPYSLSGTASVLSDYIAPSGTLIIPAGTLSGSVSISIVNDAVVESTESLVLSMGTPVGANRGTNSVHTISIADNDVAPAPTPTPSPTVSPIPAPSPTVAPKPTVQWEGAGQTLSESFGTIHVTAALSTASSSSTSVPYSISGSATPSSDYNAANGTIFFPAGVTRISVAVAIVNDTVVEPNETIILTLGTPVGATLGTRTTHTITIQNDDVAPVPSPTPTATIAPSPTPTATVAPSPTPAPTYTQTPGGTGAVYYVSSSGSDANSGLSASSPWQTLGKVNGIVFKPGDTILFKRGDTFYGTLALNSAGVSSNPVTYGAYGSGAKPVITGFRTITGWTNEGGGIYSKVITSESQTNMVSMDGVNTRMGRYPNSSYLHYESSTGNTSITDNELGTSVNWTGAELAIRKNDWTLDRARVTSHSGNTLYYTNMGTNYNASPNFGYFIQNDLRTLDQLGEWYHQTSTGKFYMYFGTVDPNTKTVKVATLKNVVSNAKLDGMYVVIDNLALTGSIGNAVSLSATTAQNYTIQNCDVSFFGATGINTQVARTTIHANTVSEGAYIGINVAKEYARVTNNRVFNIGLVLGQSLIGINNGIHLANANNSLTQYNVLENIGYDGIFVKYGSNIVVKNNFINNVVLNMNDGGGIYTDQVSTNFTIDGNIILNVRGSRNGGASVNGSPLIVEGIYLDEYSAGITVINNTMAHGTHGGIKLHKANNNIIRNNISYNNGVGIDFLNSLSSGGTMTGNSITGNQFIAKTPTQLVLNFITRANDGCAFGTADGNYYARPIKDDYSFYTWEPNVTTWNRTLASWQSYVRQDFNSKKSPQAITSESDLQFEYNATQSPKVIPLTRAMIDVKGVKYSGSVTLQPYTSIVLMRDASVP